MQPHPYSFCHQFTNKWPIGGQLQLSYLLTVPRNFFCAKNSSVDYSSYNRMPHKIRHVCVLTYNICSRQTLPAIISCISCACKFIHASMYHLCTLVIYKNETVDFVLLKYKSPYRVAGIYVEVYYFQVPCIQRFDFNMHFVPTCALVTFERAYRLELWHIYLIY